MDRPEIRLPISELALTRTCLRFQPNKLPGPHELNAHKSVGYSQDQDAVHFPEGFFSFAELERLLIRLRELRDLDNERRKD